MAPLRAVNLAGKGSDRPYRPPRPRPREIVVEPYVPAAIPFTMRDLARSPVWIGVWDKRPVQWRADGVWMGWRYSRPEGVAVARFGGTVETRHGPLHILPWSPARGVSRMLAKYGQVGGASPIVFVRRRQNAIFIRHRCDRLRHSFRPACG